MGSDPEKCPLLVAWNIDRVKRATASETPFAVLVHNFTSTDFQALARDNALALKHGGPPPRADYDRRTGFVVDGICISLGATV